LARSKKEGKQIKAKERGKYKTKCYRFVDEWGGGGGGGGGGESVSGWRNDRKKFLKFDNS
jgi:hypothetical protein